IRDRLPDLRAITRDPRYFPYRYGEALLAYIGGRFGDEAVVRYFLAAGMVGIDPAFERVLGLSSKQVFRDWQESARQLYNPVIDSAGAWSPDSKRLAFILFEKGDNYLGIVDVASRDIDHIRVPNLDAISSASWAPDGRSIVLSGQRTGVTDLFIYNLDTHNVR